MKFLEYFQNQIATVFTFFSQKLIIFLGIFTIFSVQNTTFAITENWNTMPTWVKAENKVNISGSPYISTGIDEYPNPTFKISGGISLKYFIQQAIAQKVGDSCTYINNIIISQVKNSGETVRIDSCNSSAEIQDTYVDRSNLSAKEIQVHGLSGLFSVNPFVSGVNIGILLNKSRVKFTITSIITRPTFNLEFNAFVKIGFREGFSPNGEPPVVVSAFDLTLPVGSLGSNNVLQLFAKFNTAMLNTAKSLCQLSRDAGKAALQTAVNNMLLYDPNSPVQGGYSKLEYLAWNEHLGTIFFLFTGGAAKIPLVGKGVIKGSIWWDSSLTKTTKSCAGLSVDVFIKVGFDTVLVGDGTQVKVGKLQSLTYRQVGTDSICDFVIVGLPENSDLSVVALTTLSAFTQRVTSIPFTRGFQIPGGSCTTISANPSPVPGYLRDIPEICGESVSLMNLKLQIAPPEPK